jgi:uncharacterized cupredoxin-like copper-binding protein
VMRMPTLLAFGAATAALALAGCGGGGGSTSTSASSTPATSTPAPASTTPASSGGGGANLKISADANGQLAFNTKTLSAKAGKVTITMSNPSQIPHGVGVNGGGVNKVGAVVNQGGSSSVTVTLKPGKYTFFCPVPGHEQAGMKGTLTVQ